MHNDFPQLLVSNTNTNPYTVDMIYVGNIICWRRGNYNHPKGLKKISISITIFIKKYYKGLTALLKGRRAKASAVRF